MGDINKELANTFYPTKKKSKNIQNRPSTQNLKGDVWHEYYDSRRAGMQLELIEELCTSR